MTTRVFGSVKGLACLLHHPWFFQWIMPWAALVGGRGAPKESRLEERDKVLPRSRMDKVFRGSRTAIIWHERDQSLWHKWMPAEAGAGISIEEKVYRERIRGPSWGTFLMPGEGNPSSRLATQ
jgi:hypothetical protein